MSIKIDNDIYILSSYQCRQEREHKLVFFPKCEKVFVANDVAFIILTHLNSDITDIFEICSSLVHAYNIKLEIAEQEVASFVNKLISLGLLESGGKEISKRKVFESPILKCLEDMYEGGQCKTFAMPKRSCKTLPSGIFSHKDKV